MANEYPYVNSANKLQEFLSKIGNIGVPSKVNQKFLESLGYKSTNDRRFLSVLRFLGLTDGSGTPTEDYRATLRGGKQGQVKFAKLVRENYADLFSTYPDADRKDNEALQNFFTAHTDVGGKAVQSMTATFKAVCSFANFDSETPSVADITGKEQVFDEQSDAPSISVKQRTALNNPGQALTINVNIQLELPATSDSGVYDALFESMAKHIMQLPQTE